MIVCLPEDLPTAALADGRDLSLLGITATATALFWTVPTVRVWQRGDLIDRRAGKRGPRWCAGGPLRLLNLDGMRHAAGIAAAVRHHTWAATVRGTRNAGAWPDYLGRHLQHGDRYPLAAAQRDFEAQPRILAMRAHNAAQPHAPQLDPYEVDAYQTGHAAYQHLHAAAAVCGDAVRAADSTALRPASGELTDRITYLAAANAHLARLRPDARLLALTV
ncbi:hypothetical protein GCM10010124_31560 [Pilimelia terevasa]|uniref:Uncharacterized protein n=1 Tax=Pilimelia terevasa TaxID=53372 RepID=A0A8J3BPC8_9ACTN|nr:hypothetical protein [Pilimelia terevasa]GGK36583.1 hypothetical protein GCM10010124_31560 [Pilimelia terevasa]